MSQQSVQVTVAIEKPPEAVIDFVSDVRNRAKYIQTLRAISDVAGEPGVDQSWHWKWDLFDQAFEGTGKCTAYEAGKRYAFVTEGGIASQFNYEAETSGDGTALTITVNFEVPASVAGHAGLEDLLASAKQRGQEAVQSLKQMLES